MTPEQATLEIPHADVRSERLLSPAHSPGCRASQELSLRATQKVFRTLPDYQQDSGYRLHGSSKTMGQKQHLYYSSVKPAEFVFFTSINFHICYHAEVRAVCVTPSD